MIISVKVITNAKQNKVFELGDCNFKIYLTCIPEKGKANLELIKLLSKHFDTPKSAITITSGIKSHNKVIEIQNTDC